MTPAITVATVTTVTTVTTRTGLAQAAAEAMTTSPGELVILDSETGDWRPYPWGAVHWLACAVAARLHDGPTAPNALGLVGDPTVEFVAAIPGAWYAGAAVSILPGPVRGADPAHWARATLDRFAAIGVDTVASHGEQLALLGAAGTPLRLLDLADLGTARAGRVDLCEPARAAVLQGTAGSTGVPKTAVLGPQAVLRNAQGLAVRLGLDSGHDIGQSWLPIYHDMGLAFLNTALLSGAPFWLAPTTAFAASPFRWLNWLSESRATFTGAPNFAYTVIGRYARRVSDVDLSGVRAAVNGGEPIDYEGNKRFLDEMSRFGFDPEVVAPAYGLAEATCAVTTPRLGHGGLRFDEVAGGRRHVMLGEPIEGMQVRITPVEQDPEQSFGHEVGAVEIRGSSMMRRYLGDDDIDPESWFGTGDLGYLVDGELVVCGRAKELITIAGRNIFPAEVERIAETVRGVREGGVVAVGVDGARPGLVISAEYRGPDEAAARREVIETVASECGVVPAEVTFVRPGTLPRTSSGKLRRLEVRRDLERQAGRE